jgi:hypothetical protein
MRITGLVAAATLSACHPVIGIVGDGNGPRSNTSICDSTHDNTCALGGGRGNATVAYAAIAGVLLVPLVLKFFRPEGSYHDR